jgi:hypothetical protein
MEIKNKTCPQSETSGGLLLLPQHVQERRNWSSNLFALLIFALFLLFRIKQAGMKGVFVSGQANPSA